MKVKMTTRCFVRFLVVSVALAGLQGCDNSDTSGELAQYVLTGQVGPWTDPGTGLTWQVSPTGGFMSWAAAESHCSNLDLAGGGWRLPTIGELRTLIRGCPATEAGGSCNIEEGNCLKWSCRDGSCDGCSFDAGPADGCYWPDEIEGECSWYWSSSPVEDGDGYAWDVSFHDGYVGGHVVNDGLVIHVRCVR